MFPLPTRRVCRAGSAPSRASKIPAENPGGMINVTDEMGIVALIGVTTATYLCAASFLSHYMSP
jgi:hypothetical protein